MTPRIDYLAEREYYLEHLQFSSLMYAKTKKPDYKEVMKNVSSILSKIAEKWKTGEYQARCKFMNENILLVK